MNLKVSFMQLVTNKSWSGSCWEFKSFCSTSKQGEEGERIAKKVKAKSAIKVHLIHGPWMKRRDDDMLNKKARNFEASWQTHPCHEMSSTMSRRQTHRKCCNKTWACPPSGPSWDPPGNQLGWTTCLILVLGSPRWHRRGHGHTGVGRTSTLGVALVSDFFGDTIKFFPQLKNKILLPCGKTQPRYFGVCLSPSSWRVKIQPAVFWAK